MRRVARFFICFASAIAFSGPPSAWHGTSQRDELLMSRNGVPLSRVIKDPRAKGPVVVVFKNSNGPHLAAPPAGQRQLEWIAFLAPIALVVHVDQVVPKLTSNEDWVFSTVHATIETVIKQPPTESLSGGQAIEFQQDGGELVTDEHRVRAVVPYADPHMAGRRYLVIAKRNPDDVIPSLVGPPGWLSVYEPTSYLINPAGRLQSLCTGDGCRWPHSENGIELSEAIRRITTGKEAR